MELVMLSQKEAPCSLQEGTMAGCTVILTMEWSQLWTQAQNLVLL